MATIVDHSTTDAGIGEEARRADGAAEERWRRYQSRFSLREMFAEQNRLLIDRIGAASRLLEVGAGVGTFLADAVRTPGFKRVYAVEVSLASAKLASSHQGASMVLAPAERLPFRSGCFDAIVLLGVLHHLSDPAAGIRKMHRVLCPGGRLVILEGNPASRYRGLLLGVADLLGVPHEDTQYLHSWPDEIARLLVSFRASSSMAVNGMFAPLSYVGFGGPLTWRLLTGLRRATVRLWPSGFAWWLLWTADK